MRIVQRRTSVPAAAAEPRGDLLQTPLEEDEEPPSPLPGRAAAFRSRAALPGSALLRLPPSASLPPRRTASSVCLRAGAAPARTP